MDHIYIEENNIVDRYLMGQLDQEEVDRFADHSIGCQRCLDNLEQGERMHRAMRRVFLQDVSRTAAVSLWARLIRAGMAGRVVLVGAALILIGLPLGLLVRQQRLSAELAEMSRLLRRAETPRINVPIVRLSPIRSSGEARDPVTMITISQEQWLVFALEVDDPGTGPFRVTLFEGEKQLWRAEDLKPDSLEEVVLGLSSTFLYTGDFRLLLEGFDAGGTSFPVSRFSFRVTGEE